MKIIIHLIAILLCIQLHAQTITGRIIDKANNKPLQFATVIIKKDTSDYKTGVSDTLGHYSFSNVGVGAYSIEFSFINYQKVTISLTLTGDTVIKDVALVPASGQLQAVTLTARKPVIERKVDRLVFNVANNVNLTGLDGLELLAKAPQIRIDGNSISMIGKGSVRVMINDRLLQMSGEALAAYLKALPVESVESIEVITNPPAMYSAEGHSGLINIVLKRKREPGYRGTVNLNLTSPPSPKIYPGISMNYNKKNVRYYGNINLSKGYQNPRYTTTVFYPNRTQGAATKVKEESQYAGGQVGFDADLNRTNTLGMSFNIFYSYPYQTNTIRTIFSNSKTHYVDSISEQHIRDKIAYYSRSANIHYVKNFDTVTKRRVVLDADWFTNGFHFPNTINSDMYDTDGKQLPGRALQTISNNSLSSVIYSLNAVVYLPAKKYELYFGGKANFIKSSNEVGLDIFNIDRNMHELNAGNAFSFRENTQALFVNFKKDLNKKWSFQTGLRGENTQTRGVGSDNVYDSVNKNSYFKLFPTAYLTYKVSEKNTLSVNYGRRISRPGFNSFNPYAQYSSQYQYSEGNPYLLPSISNNFELSETVGDFYVSAQYSFSNGGVGNIGRVDTNSNISITKPYNFISNRSFVVSTYYTFDKIKWLQSSNEFDVYHKKIISSSSYTEPVIKAWAANFRSDNSIFFNKAKTVIGGLYFYYQFPEVNGINQFKRFYYFDISGKYSMLKNSLQFSIRLSDVFKTLNLPFSNTVNNILTTNVVNNDSRRLYLSVRYNFGNSKLKKGEAHSVDAENKRAF